MISTAALVRRVRRRHKLRRCDLARLLGVGWNTVRRWETGERRPRGDHLETLLELDHARRSSRLR